jgi:hypothetical protein
LPRSFYRDFLQAPSSFPRGNYRPLTASPGAFYRCNLQAPSILQAPRSQFTTTPRWFHIPRSCSYVKQSHEQSLAWWSLCGTFFNWSGFYELTSLARLPHIFAYPSPDWVLVMSRNKCGATLTPSVSCGKYTRGIFLRTHTTFIPRDWAMTVFSLPEFYYILRALPNFYSKYEAHE